jgi:hypothetical protein
MRPGPSARSCRIACPYGHQRTAGACERGWLGGGEVGDAGFLGWDLVELGEQHVRHHGQRAVGVVVSANGRKRNASF